LILALFVFNRPRGSFLPRVFKKHNSNNNNSGIFLSHCSVTSCQQNCQCERFPSSVVYIHVSPLASFTVPAGVYRIIVGSFSTSRLSTAVHPIITLRGGLTQQQAVCQSVCPSVVPGSAYYRSLCTMINASRFRLSRANEAEAAAVACVAYVTGVVTRRVHNTAPLWEVL